MSDYFWKEMNFSLDNLVLSSVSLSLWRRANAQNVSLETLGGGQFTLSTQLIMTKVSCYNHPPTQHHSFFGKLPPLFINFSVVTCLIILHSSSRWWFLGRAVCSHLQQRQWNILRWKRSFIPFVWLESAGSACHHGLVSSTEFNLVRCVARHKAASCQSGNRGER